jgi:hypothetical protein
MNQSEQMCQRLLESMDKLRDGKIDSAQAQAQAALAKAFVKHQEYELNAARQTQQLDILKPRVTARLKDSPAA